MTRLMITLSSDEISALTRTCEAELREPREQARFLLREALIRRGLLTNLPAPDVQASIYADKGSEHASAK